VLYLEENTKRAAGLTMAVKFLPEELAVLKHKLMSRIHDGAIAMRAIANGPTDRNEMIMPLRIFYESLLSFSEPDCLSFLQ
jgi:hypothetical protein